MNEEKGSAPKFMFIYGIVRGTPLRLVFFILIVTVTSPLN